MASATRHHRKAQVASGLEAKEAGRVQHIVSGQVAAAQLAVTREGLPTMQHTPVVHEQGLQRE